MCAQSGATRTYQASNQKYSSAEQNGEQNAEPDVTQKLRDLHHRNVERQDHERTETMQRLIAVSKRPTRLLSDVNLNHRVRSLFYGTVSQIKLLGSAAANELIKL